MPDDYELMPHEAVEKLKKELGELKKRAAPASPEIKDSIDKLNENIDNLKSMFEQAAEDIKKEEETEEEILEKVDPLVGRVNVIEDENRKIAEAILVIADMIKERLPKKKIPVVFKKPSERPMPIPAFRQAPRPPMPPRPPIPPLEKPPGMPPKPPVLPLEEKPLMPPIIPTPPPRPPVPPLGIPRPGIPPLPGKPPEILPIRAPGAAPTPMPPGPMPPEPLMSEEVSKKKGFFARLFKRKE